VELDEERKKGFLGSSTLEICFPISKRRDLSLQTFGDFGGLFELSKVLLDLNWDSMSVHTQRL
jgi:hypothetical protein